VYPSSRLSPTTDVPPPGSPCWLELATTQPQASMAFYQDVMGWDYEERTDSDGAPYYVATLVGEPVAGIRHIAEPVEEWSVFLVTPDLTALVRRSELLGGRTVEPAHSVPKVGRKALIEAPAGATFGACQVAPDWAFTAGVPNSLVWLEFITHLVPQADRYFGELFGYEGRQFGNGIEDDYMVWYAGGDSVIGRVRMMPGTSVEVPARWMPHFRTPLDRNFDDAVVTAHDAGARLRFNPYSSELGRVAVLTDPVGARFAIIDPSLAIEGGSGSAADDPYDD
jgi:predicted enzyme related to lactoylglutathione lyase